MIAPALHSTAQIRDLTIVKCLEALSLNIFCWGCGHELDKRASRILCFPPPDGLRAGPSCSWEKVSKELLESWRRHDGGNNSHYLM